MGKREHLILRKILYYYPDCLAIRMRILDGHSDYVKFVILGTARTGSNFLRSLLNLHTQVIAFGEIFRSEKAIGWDFPGYFQYGRKQSLFQNDPVGFLGKKVFNKFPKRISAVGFKIFYEHAKTEKWKSVWLFLKNQKDLRIIHLKRKNILKSHLSRAKAVKTGRWVNKSGVKEDNSPIFLDYEDCLRAFKETQENEKKYDTYFENNHKIDVMYENLSADYKSEMKRIQKFLNVDYEFLIPSTNKQSRQPLSKTISNYFELKEKFEGTQWEGFFED